METKTLRENRTWPTNTPVMVSIVVATYNHHKFIEETIESFLMQEVNFRVEILINDDASTDTTAAIVEKYENKHPGLFRNFYQKENQYSKGIKPWIHVLFPAAKGKYIALCDGDDYWTDPLKLQKQVDFLERNVEYNYCGHNSFTKQNDQIKKVGLDFKTLTFKELIFKNRLNTSTLVFRRKSIFHFPDFFYTLSAGDWAIQLLAIKESKAYVLNDYMSVYRLHEGGIWSTLDNQTMCRQGVQIMNAFKEIYNDKKSIKLIDAAINERKKSFGLINQNYFKLIQQKLNLILKSIRRNKPNIALRVKKKLKSIFKF